jgi:glycosyltransferase involved in cell wall biosynthesis
MENSSNALGESQIIGVPSVTTDCGGTLSIITHNENGLIFQRGNAYDLAMKIKAIFTDDNLAIRLSNGGKIAGKQFHNQEKILEQYTSIYNKILID